MEEVKQLNVGDKIHFKSWKKLLATALDLSSLGYGVAVLGFADMSENVLTVTALPTEGE